MSEVLLLACWRQLLISRADAASVENRTVRRIIALMPDRGYVANAKARRDARLAALCSKAADDAATLAQKSGPDAAYWEGTGQLRTCPPNSPGTMHRVVANFCASADP